MKNFLFHYWMSCLAVSAILYLSFAHPVTFSRIPSFENADKLAHLIIYSVVTIILIFDFRTSQKPNTHPLYFVLVCLVFPTFLGGIIEIIQPLYFAPRSGSLGDFLANVAGVFIGWAVMHIFKNHINRVFIRNQR